MSGVKTVHLTSLSSQGCWLLDYCVSATSANINGIATSESIFVFPPSRLPPSLLFVIRAAWLQEAKGLSGCHKAGLHHLFILMIERRDAFEEPYHNGRLTSDDTSCCTTRFLSWGNGVSWIVIADSLSDLCYNWYKTQIASETVLPRLKPLSVHTSIIWQRRAFSLRVGLLTKAVKSSGRPGWHCTLNVFQLECLMKYSVKNISLNNKMFDTVTALLQGSEVWAWRCFNNSVWHH